jgi:hypothetical protein
LDECLSDSELGHEGSVLRKKRSSLLNEQQVRNFASNSGKHPEQNVKAFPGRATPDMEQVRSPHLHTPWQIDIGTIDRELGRDTVGSVDQLPVIQETVFLDSQANLLGAVEDQRCPLKSAELGTRHCRPPQRCCRGVVQQAGKSVEVVAVDPCALRRENVGQLGVTVIDDVEEVVPSPLAQKA